MPKITIVDGNQEITLSTIEENIRAYMVKGEAGSDGVSPTASVSKVDDTTTITITDKNGTTEADILDGYNPRVDVSKANRVTTLTTTDFYGTETVQISDGIDLTGGVPTNGVIGFDGVAADIPNGYVVTTDPFPGSTGGGIIALKTITTAPSTFSEGDKYYNSTDDLIYTATSSSAWDSGETPTATSIYLNEADNELYRYYNNQMNKLESGGGDTIPVGIIFEFPTTDSTKLPTGYLFCDGSAVSRTTYSDLFAILGTRWGAGDGSTTFNLPTKEGLVTVGYDSSDTDFDTLGETGGDGSHNNLQPYTVSNFIIKATKTTPTQAEVVNSYSTSTEDTYSASYVNSNFINTPTVLYDNSSGTTGTVTLSETANNFEYLEIFYGKNNNEASVKVMRNSGKAMLFDYANLGSAPQLLVKEVNISGTSITHNSGYYLNFTSTGVSSGSVNEIKIYRVLGYE